MKLNEIPTVEPRSNGPYANEFANIKAVNSQTVTCFFLLSMLAFLCWYNKDINPLKFVKAGLNCMSQNFEFNLAQT